MQAFGPLALPFTCDTAVAVGTRPFANNAFINWTLAPGQGPAHELNLALTALVSMLTGPGPLSADRMRAGAAGSDAAGLAPIRTGTA